jgi:hypothetical protein
MADDQRIEEIKLSQQLALAVDEYEANKDVCSFHLSSLVEISRFYLLTV